MTSDIISIMEQLEMAAEEDEYEELYSLEADLYSALQERRAENRVPIEQAKAVLERGTDDGVDEETLTTLVRKSIAMNLSEAGLIGSARLTATNPLEADLDEFGSGLKKKREAEIEFRDLAAEAGDVLEELRVPGRLTLFGTSVPDSPVPKGVRLDAGTTVRNVGDTPVDDVAVTTESGTAVDVSDGSGTPEMVAAGEAVRFDVSIVATVTGRTDLTFVVKRGEKVVARDRSTLHVEAKGTLIESAAENLSDLRSNTEQVSHGGVRQSLLAKVATAEETVGEADAATDSGDSDDADRRLKTAIKVLGAYQNELLSGDRGNSSGNGESDPRVAPDLRVSLRSEADAVIDQIATARDAQL